MQRISLAQDRESRDEIIFFLFFSSVFEMLLRKMPGVGGGRFILNQSRYSYSRRSSDTVLHRVA